MSESGLTTQSPDYICRLSESLHIDHGLTKNAQYEQLIPQLMALIGDESNNTAILSTVAAALHESFNFFWTGFYLVEQNELVVGPFQGPVACLRIEKGKGVCGTAWLNKESIVVPDVDQYPGHIACSPISKSEIVVPIFSNSGEVIGVLDIDSAELNTFAEQDQNNLEKLCKYLGEKLS